MDAWEFTEYIFGMLLRLRSSVVFDQCCKQVIAQEVAPGKTDAQAQASAAI